MKHGKYDDITLEQYHSMEGWSKTKLDRLDKSVQYMLHCQEQGQDSTPAMVFGAAFHCAVLTPELYESEYIIAPKCDRRTKVGKELYASFLEEAEGKTVIDSEMAANIELMKTAIFNHPLASAFLKNGEAEQSFFWEDSETGLLCKCRPDYLTHTNVGIDLKTTDDARYESFQRTSLKFRYDVQAAFFTDGIFQAENRVVEDFVFIVIEKKPPFGIMVYVIDENFTEHGRLRYKENLRVAKDFENNPDNYKLVYPESEDPVSLLIPHWAE